MAILLTGCAGFIGWRIADKLLREGNEVVGIDNLNNYYDVRIKRWRLNNLKAMKGFIFYELDIEDYDALKTVFDNHRFSVVINEAARAGVRYSMEDPWVYMRTNAYGSLNLLELMKFYDVNKFVLASTSSLYAGNEMPFLESLAVNEPISPYAASKKSAEVMSYTFHYLYGIDVSILRYFTVYGPAGRPDMSVFRFIHWIMRGDTIEIFGDGTQSRDFTYVDDIVKGTLSAMRPVGYEIINLGNNSPNKLSYMLSLVEKIIGKKAKIVYKPFHKADLKDTWANVDKAKKLLDWKPNISLEDGIQKTISWFYNNWEWLKDIKI